MSLMLELVQSPTEEVVALVEELEAELSGDFAAHQRHGYNIDRIFQPNVLFFVAWLDGRAVGCGGIALEDGYAEVKRMYVRAQSRGRGIGGAILQRLEKEARSRGLHRIVLETGDVLHPAIRLYESAGFKRCEIFGAYVNMAPEAIARSVFMEKRLDAAKDSSAGEQ